MDEMEMLKQRVELLEGFTKQLLQSDRYTVQKDLQMFDGKDIQTAKSTGTRIATDVDQKIGFWGEVPIIQPNTTDTPRASFTENAGGINVNDDSTFGGWTIGEIAQALINAGILDGTVN